MPGFPDKFAPFYKRPPGSTISTLATRLVGSFVRPLRRLSQHERNREPRWHDQVPSGWALEYDTVTITHKIMEFFYDRLQYFGSERPGRQKAIEQYHSGYITPAEAAYGEDYQMLPEQREALAQQRDAPRRPGSAPQAQESKTPEQEK
jgi:hydrogenase small subunit